MPETTEEITPAEIEWPSEPLDAGHPEHRTALLMVRPAIRTLTRAKAALRPITLEDLRTLPGTTQYVRRGDWGARAPSGRYAKLTGKPMTTLHWEGPTMGAFPHDKCDDKVRTIQAYHMDRQRWLDIAYTMLACPHGYLFEGRGYWNRTAANGTNAGNDQSYAICYLGGVGDPFTNEAKKAILDGVLLLRQHGGATEETRCHIDWRATQCPGNEIIVWERAGMAPPPGYVEITDPVAPQPDPGGGTLSFRVPDPLGFIDDPTSDGGWLVSRSGGIFTKAPAAFYGSLGHLTLNAPISAFLPTPTGKGYWLFAEDGGVFSFGDAPFNGTYGALSTEYFANQRKVVGAYFRGDKADRSTWRYSLVSDRLESYDI